MRLEAALDAIFAGHDYREDECQCQSIAGYSNSKTGIVTFVRCRWQCESADDQLVSLGNKDKEETTCELGELPGEQIRKLHVKWSSERDFHK